MKNGGIYMLVLNYNSHEYILQVNLELRTQVLISG